MNPRFARRFARAVAVLALGALASSTHASCSASAVPTLFGSYNPLSASANDSTGSVTVTCGINAIAILQSYTVALSTGSSGSYAPRRLHAGASTLQYQLYRDAGRTSVWGDGSGGTAIVSGGFLLSVLVPVSATHTVYGRLPGLQTTATAGSYTDTITVTVTY